MKIAFVSASWHSDLMDAARESCLKQLHALGIDPEKGVDQFNVPGSLEIPLMAQKLALTKRYAGIICFGWIVDGGIYRHEFVSQAVIDGLVRVQLDSGVPVFSCVLTPKEFRECPGHFAFFREHLTGKGRDVAGAAVNFIRLLATVEGVAGEA
jgi:6,7-dimethyl-8-ribityllumazine synthase